MHPGLGVPRTGGPDSTTSCPPEGRAHREHREKLELVASFSFFGNVMSMASVQLAGAKRDALLLSFKDAKVGMGQGRTRGGWTAAGAAL